MSAVGTCSAIIVGAGNGVRFGAPYKAVVDLRGLPLIEYSVRTFCEISAVVEIVLVLSRDTVESGREVGGRYQDMTRIVTCLGGETRSDSVRAGLERTSSSSHLVAIHDGARPLLTKELATRLIQAAGVSGAAAPALPISDTVLGVDENATPHSAIDRGGVRTVQTPQVARRDWLVEALDHRKFSSTDESSALLEAGYSVTLVDGDPDNIKITWPRDLYIAETILKARALCV